MSSDFEVVAMVQAENYRRAHCGILPDAAEVVLLPTRSGRRASALRSGRPGRRPGWRRQRSPRHLHHPRCWSPGRWSPCGGRPSWVPCTDSSDSTSARGSRSISASSDLARWWWEVDENATRGRQTPPRCFSQARTELAHYRISTGGWCST